MNYQKHAPEQTVKNETEVAIAATNVAPNVTEYKIGPYDHCTYHKSGLFSTIYKGFSPGSSEARAIKVTTPSTDQAPHNSAREARLLREMNHVNVVSSSLSPATKTPLC